MYCLKLEVWVLSLFALLILVYKFLVKIKITDRDMKCLWEMRIKESGETVVVDYVSLGPRYVVYFSLKC